MAPGRSRNLARSLRLAVALVASLLGGAAARADCGQHDRPVLPIAAPLASAGVARSNEGGIPAPAGGPRPCNGPSCSRQPAHPLGSPAPVWSPADPAAGAAFATPPRAPIAAHRFATSTAIGYTAPSGSPPDRPPRP